MITNNMNFSIWSEAFWLPKTTSWKEFDELEKNGTHVAHAHHLFYVYPLAILIYLARILFEYAIAQPLGRFLHIRDHQNLSDKTKKPIKRPSPLAKFSESTWRFTFYLAIFLYGVTILRNVR